MTVKALGLQELAATPYQNRPGGLSRDVQLRLRPLTEVQNFEQELI